MPRPWNKGLKKGMPGAQTNYNTEGLKKGRGWNKGIPNPEAAERMRANNPNHDGRVNKQRAEYRPKDDPYQIYRDEVTKFTRRSERLMEIPEERGKYNGCLQLDHIIPYKQGYKLGISPEIMGSVHNLQWITQEENREKWDEWASKEVVDGILRQSN